jgi:hypothetical protein
MKPLANSFVTWVRLAAAALLTAGIARAGDANLLRNPGFEDGGDPAANWMTIFPPALADPRPQFATQGSNPRTGKSCGTIDVRYQGGFTSFSQNVTLDSKARSYRFAADVRIDDATLAGHASLALWFTIPGEPDGGRLATSRALRGPADWTRLEIEGAIPDGATEVVARLGVSGPAAASFDDAIFTTSPKEVGSGRLVVTHCDLTARAANPAKEPWVRCSIPIPLHLQLPLAVRVTTDPPGRVAGLALASGGENRSLGVRLTPMKGGESVDVKVETLVLLRDRPLERGAGVRLPKRSEIPKDVAVHLAAAPGVDVEAKEIAALAKTLPRDDLAALMTGLCAVLKDELDYQGGSHQGAVECLASGKAVCTGYANVAASLLIASGVPARILAVVTLDSRLQEHYVVEAWTKPLGWSRVESTMARFPFADSEQVVLRVVAPDDTRTPYDVPIFIAAGDGAAGSFKLGDDSCWQGSSVLASLSLDPRDAKTLHEKARAGLEQFAKKPVKTSRAAFLAADSLPPSLRDSRLSAALEEFLSIPD